MISDAVGVCLPITYPGMTRRTDWPEGRSASEPIAGCASTVAGAAPRFACEHARRGPAYNTSNDCLMQWRMPFFSAHGHLHCRCFFSRQSQNCMAVLTAGAPRRSIRHHRCRVSTRQHDERLQFVSELHEVAFSLSCFAPQNAF